MVCYSYKDTRLSVFRPAASRNLNLCCSWPQADTGSSLSISTYTQHWDLPGTSGQGRGEQGDQPGSKSANPHPPGHQPTSSCWKSFPFAKYWHTGFHSTALIKPLSGFLQACRGKDCFRQFLGEKRLFSHKLLLFAEISSGPTNIKHMGSTTTPEKWRLLPLQSTHQPRRHILQNNLEVPIWSKHYLARRLPFHLATSLTLFMTCHPKQRQWGQGQVTPCLQLPH